MEYKKMKHLRLDDTVYALTSNFIVIPLRITRLITGVDTNLIDIQLRDNDRHSYTVTTYKEKRSFAQSSFIVYLDMPSLAAHNLVSLESSIKRKREELEKLETQLLDFQNLVDGYNGFNEGG